MKIKKVFFLLIISTNVIAQNPGAGVTDIDGNNYQTVIIGSQEWMKENLRVTKYSNGNSIPNIIDAYEWAGIFSGAWCHNNNNSQYENTYGKLYNWYVVSDSRNVCPIGWHVPTDGEWTILTDYLGGEAVAGVKMKSTSGWNSNGNGTNESGFSGLPGGRRTVNVSSSSYGIFQLVGGLGHWWSSTFQTGVCSYARQLWFWDEFCSQYGPTSMSGLSIRCIKSSPSLETIELLPNQKELIKIIDLMGKETEYKPNTVLIYVYSDGTTEKVLQIEH